MYYRTHKLWELIVPINIWMANFYTAGTFELSSPVIIKCLDLKKKKKEMRIQKKTDYKVLSSSYLTVAVSDIIKSTDVSR